MCRIVKGADTSTGCVEAVRKSGEINASELSLPLRKHLNGSNLGTERTRLDRLESLADRTLFEQGVKA